jgi:hypothetical protein
MYLTNLNQTVAPSLLGGVYLVFGDCHDFSSLAQFDDPASSTIVQRSTGRNSEIVRCGDADRHQLCYGLSIDTLALSDQAIMAQVGGAH